MFDSIDWNSPSRTDAELPAIPVAVKFDVMDDWHEFFRQKHGVPAGWEMCKVDYDLTVAPKGFAKVEGGFRATRRNGIRAWRGRDKSGDATFFYKISDLTEFLKQQCLARGVCFGCRGEGRICTRTSTNGDNRYRLCRECGGTGKLSVPASSTGKEGTEK